MPVVFGSVERLPVFKALGDNTRYAIYLELARSSVPLSTADIADALELHPNTVRPHLERMRDVGLLVVEADSRGSVGRPQHRYSVAPDAPTLGLEPSSFRLLARLLASVAAATEAEPDLIAAVGRDQGRGAAVARAAVAGSAGTTTARCLAALTAELADLGFDPAAATDGKTTTVAYTNCPFSELAAAHPEVVCHLHRGIVEGMVEELGGVDVRVERFATLEDRDPCRVDLAVR
jgi:predicted ArsR family transcriptional regulator